MHTVARQKLAAADVLLAGFFAASQSCTRDSGPQVLHERTVPLRVRYELSIFGINPRNECGHAFAVIA